MTKHHDENYYKVLGIEYHATDNDIKSAYRRLMLQYHPDVSKEPVRVDNFERVVRAYKVLSDSKKRAEYNRINNINAFRFTNHSYTGFKETHVKEFPEEKPIKSSVFSSFTDRFFNRNPEEKISDELNNAFHVSDDIIKLDIEDLINQYEISTNKFVRIESLKAIVKKLGKMSYKIIENALEDTSKEVREVAIKAIGLLQIRQGIYSLEKLYKESSTDVKKSIVISVANLQFQKSNDLLLKFCYDYNDDIKLIALKAVQQYKLKNVSLLKGLLHDKNPSIKQLVQNILKNS